MKKVFNTILALLLLLGVMGCKNPITESEVTVPSRPEVKGIELALEEVEGANNVTVQRKDKGAEAWTDYRMSAYNIPALKDPNNSEGNGKIVDYFVEPGKEYDYQIIYKDNSYKELKTSSITTAKATDGFGEYGLNKETKAVFDDKTGIMTFTPNPNLNEKINRARPDLVFPDGPAREFFIKVQYEDKETSKYVPNIKIDNKDGVINFEKEFQSYTNLYGKTLTLNSISMSTSIYPTSYSNTISLEELKTVTPILPETITVQDVRPEVTAEATSDGVKIKFPKINDKELKYLIVRREHKTSSEGNFIFDYYDCKSYDLNTSEITDYFTEPGYIYRYSITYKDKDDITIIDSKKSNEIAATAGVGQLVIPETFEVKYDEKTGIMSFPDMLGLKSQLENINAKKTIDLKVNYYNHIDLYGYLDNDSFTINWLNELIKYSNRESTNVEQYFGTDLHYYSINNFELNINNIKYNLKYDYNNTMRNSLPPSIKLPNLNPIPNYSNNAEGIKFIIEGNYDNLNSIKITRTSEDNSTTQTINLPNDYMNDTDKFTEVLDPYVEPGKKYTYKVYIDGYSSNPDMHYRPIEITANGGVGEVINSNSLKYDNETDILTYTSNTISSFNTLDFNYSDVETGTIIDSGINSSSQNSDLTEKITSQSLHGKELYLESYTTVFTNAEGRKFTVNGQFDKTTSIHKFTVPNLN